MWYYGSVAVKGISPIKIDPMRVTGLDSSCFLTGRIGLTGSLLHRNLILAGEEAPLDCVALCPILFSGKCS